MFQYIRKAALLQTSKLKRSYYLFLQSVEYVLHHYIKTYSVLTTFWHTEFWCEGNNESQVYMRTLYWNDLLVLLHNIMFLGKLIKCLKLTIFESGSWLSMSAFVCYEITYQFLNKLDNGLNYLFMLRLKVTHVTKRGPCWPPTHWTFQCIVSVRVKDPGYQNLWHISHVLSKAYASKMNIWFLHSIYHTGVNIYEQITQILLFAIAIATKS